MDECELMGAAFDHIKKIIAKDQSISEGMNDIIDYCNTNFKHDNWNNFRTIKFDVVTDMEAWIEKVLKKDPVPSKINGLWFGLFNPCNENDEETADMYISGNTEFDIDDDEGEWAVGPKYFPETRYAQSKTLKSIYEIAYDDYANDGLGNTAEYPLCLCYGCLIAKHLIQKYGQSMLKNDDQTIGIAVGFDSGDFLVIGELSKAGFKAR
jgi:hypothetical protein